MGTRWNATGLPSIMMVCPALAPPVARQQRSYLLVGRAVTANVPISNRIHQLSLSLVTPLGTHNNIDLRHFESKQKERLESPSRSAFNKHTIVQTMPAQQRFSHPSTNNAPYTLTPNSPSSNWKSVQYPSEDAVNAHLPLSFLRIITFRQRIPRKVTDLRIVDVGHIEEGLCLVRGEDEYLLRRR